jgi:DNA-binding response OmpR family regulator
MNMALMLIADDHRQITSVLEQYAAKEGYRTLVAGDGRATLDLFYQNQPDIVLLDVMMPVVDGFEVCREIRKTSAVPVILITARGEDFERIMGLDIGADDYIVKPFSPGEVMARVRAIMRRVESADGKNKFLYDNLAVDIEDYSVTVGGASVPLTKKETEILWALVSNRQKVFTRDNLLDSVWGYDYYGDSRTVDSHIRRLRAKLDQFDHPFWEIKTVWGVGYKFEGSAHEK